MLFIEKEALFLKRSSKDSIISKIKILIPRTKNIIKDKHVHFLRIFLFLLQEFKFRYKFRKKRNFGKQKLMSWLKKLCKKIDVMKTNIKIIKNCTLVFKLYYKLLNLNKQKLQRKTN